MTQCTHEKLASMQVAASAQRSLQERLRDLEVLNEELVIAKNAMLSDLMVWSCSGVGTSCPPCNIPPHGQVHRIRHAHVNVRISMLCMRLMCLGLSNLATVCRWTTMCRACGRSARG